MRSSPATSPALDGWHLPLLLRHRRATLVATLLLAVAAVSGGEVGRLIASHLVLGLLAAWYGVRCERGRLHQLQQRQDHLEEIYSRVVEQLWWLRRELEVRELMLEGSGNLGVDDEPTQGSACDD